MNKKEEKKFALQLTSPMLILFILLGLFPIMYSILISLFSWRLSIPIPPKFIGLGNYIKAFSDAVFVQSLLKTAFFVLITVGGSLLLGLAFSLLLNNKRIPGKIWFLTFSLIPWAIPRVSGGLMWKWIYDGNYGILNGILSHFNLIGSYKWWFIGSVWLALFLCAIVEIWRTAPFVGLMIFAGLQKIPEQLYEAASIDGANSWQKFKFITIPQLSLVILAVSILVTTWALKTFDTVYVLTGGGPGNKTMITYMYVFRQAFGYLNIGYGSALAYIITIIIICVTFLYYKIFNK